jgi:hypothetical protein
MVHIDMDKRYQVSIVSHKAQKNGRGGRGGEEYASFGPITLKKTSHISEYTFMNSVLIWSKFRRAEKALEWSRYRQR